MKITATVERTDTNFYSIISENVIAGCHFAGYGDSVHEAKQDFYEGIEESLRCAREMGKEVPVAANDIEVEFRYDIPSLFNDFDWINVSAFAKIAGVNESKMRAYKAGVATASEKTTTKILTTLRKMGAAMMTVSF